jgi:hypothetical protein
MTAESGREAFPGERRFRSLLSPALTIRVLHVALWLLVMSGPVAALVVGTHVSSLRERLDVAEGEMGVELPLETTGAEGFAELFIASYLGAGEDSTEGLDLFVEGVSLDGVEVGSWSVSRTMSLGAEEVGPGYFAVTVAAEVLAADRDSGGQTVWVPAGTRFYSVGVAETSAGYAITGLPTLMPAPVGATAPELLIRRLDGLDTASGLDDMLPRFLAAYFSGDGELTRYTSPTAHIVPVRPPPFAGVEILQTGSVDMSDGFTQVAAVVRATDSDGRAQILEYWLEVSQRDGRWEVSALLPAPPLAPSDNN